MTLLKLPKAKEGMHLACYHVPQVDTAISRACVDEALACGVAGGEVRADEGLMDLRLSMLDCVSKTDEWTKEIMYMNKCKKWSGQLGGQGASSAPAWY
eukprot:544892-Pelagomonas_calceolata.AAC.1